jgi:uncharacterized protein
MIAAVQQENDVKMIRIAKGLQLPVRVVTEKIGILGATGSGKTTTASVLVEELLRAQLPVATIDPTDAWWGLGSSKDGKAEGFPVTVLGGDHGHAPLEETAGAVIADLLADSAPPLVISLAHFTKGAMRRFLADFAERLYLKNRRALHLVWDEADEAAPQNPAKMKGGERLYGAIDQIVRRGRIRGLGVTMISQRSAEISKSILSQCSVLIAHRASHPTDLDPILDWMKGNAKDRIEEVRSTISKLKNGEAWVMSPELLGVFDRYAIRDRETFNSSATPAPGEEAVVPRRLAKPDLALLQEKMRDTIERAKANDPAALRRRISELERDIARKPAAAPPAPAKVERVEVPVVKGAELKRLETLTERLLAAQDRLAQAQQAIVTEVGTLAGRILSLNRGAVAHAAPRAAAPALPARRPIPAVPPPRAAAPRAPGGSAPEGDLGKGELRILAAAAQHPEGVTREQLTVLTGYKRSSRDTYLQRLRARGLIEDGERIRATAEGVAALGPAFEPLPTGAALLEHWLGRLPVGERVVLEVVVAGYPDAVDRQRISEATSYQRSSRDTYLQRLRSRQLVVEAGRGQVRASDTLFDAR